MFLRILAKSLKNRRTRIAIAVLAVLLGASLVSALASVSLDARGKAGKALRSYGANILLVPRSDSLPLGAGKLEVGSMGELIQESQLAALSDDIAPHMAGYVPYLYGVVQVAQQKVVLAGTSFGQVRGVSPWWQVTGRWPSEQAPEALVGSEVAQKLQIKPGSSLPISYNNRVQNLTVAGIVDTGAEEDSQVLVALVRAQELLGKEGSVSIVQVSALTDKQPVAATASQIEKRMPQVQAKVIGQIAQAEAAVLGKVELLLAIVTLLVLLTSALTMVSTMTTTVLERTKEIGLLRALGAGRGRIAQLFMAEAATIGVSGGILGCVLGFFIAQVIGLTVFGSTVSLSPLVFPLSLAVALVVALSASVIPVRRAVNVDPAITLRGE
ncbi:MAG: FtsX-like permease family protein [Chloroflexi bacterium]|nr:FtsX-like permease family protein [Chloroflexota bacterium]